MTRVDKTSKGKSSKPASAEHGSGLKVSKEAKGGKKHTKGMTNGRERSGAGGGPGKAVKVRTLRKRKAAAGAGTASLPEENAKRKTSEIAVPAKKRRLQVAQEAKGVWEKLRNKKALEKGKGTELVDKLIKLLEGDLLAFAVRHETSRIIQWTLKSGTKEQRRQVLEIIVPNVVKLSMDRYGRHVMLSALAQGRASRADLLAIYDKFCGNVQALCSSNHSADVFDCFYQTVATAAQKKSLRLELLHGKESKLLDTLMQKKTKVTSLREAITEAGPEFGQLIVEAAKATLVVLAEKENSAKQAIVHDALYDFLEYAGEKEPAMAKEISILYAPLAVHLVHTRSGALATVEVVKLVDAKNRKKLVKSLQAEVPRVAADEHGHVVIMALYDHVDDTKLLQKSVLKDHLGKNIEETIAVVNDKFASLPLLNLLAPHQTRYFNPMHYNSIWTGATTSLKDNTVRRKELLDVALPVILESVTANTVEALQSATGSKVLLELILYESESVSPKAKTQLVDSIVQSLRDVVGEGLGDEAADGGDLATGTATSLLDNTFAMRTAKYLISLSEEKSYSLGKMLSTAFKGRLHCLNRGKGSLILTQMSKMTAPFAKEAQIALAKT